MAEDLEFIDKNKNASDKQHVSKDVELSGKQPGIRNVEIQKRTTDTTPQEAKNLLKKLSQSV